MRKYHNEKHSEYPGSTFVFGSNELGIHKRGAAKYALDHCGAVLGNGHGKQGTCYALPTKETPWVTLGLGWVAVYVKAFLEHAKANPQEQFFVTRVGCGLAGYSDKDIAPLFHGAPLNCIMPAAWRGFMEEK